MLSTRRLNRFLSQTTALIGVGLLTTTLVATPLQLAKAADYVVTGGEGSKTLATGDTLVVTNTGSINSATHAVDVPTSTVSSIENNGTIVGVSNGLNLVNGSTVGSLENSGTITGSINYGILMYVSDITNDLTNNTGGTISGSNFGISVESGSSIGSLVNSGTITATNFYGIYLYKSDVTNDLTNNTGGTITGLTGLYVNDGSIANGLTNSGTIEGTGGTAIFLNDLTQDLTMTLNGGRVIGDITDLQTANGFSHIVIGGDIVMEGDYTVSTVTVADGGHLSVDSGYTVNSDINFTGLTADASVTLNGGAVTGDITDDAPTNGFSAVVIGDDYTTNGGTIITVSNLKVNTGHTLDISDHGHLNISNNIDVDGAITSSSNGLYFGWGSDFSGTLANNGSITGTSNSGVSLEYADINSLLNNIGGTISGGDFGIRMADSASISGTLTNSGSITGTNDSGIALFSGTSIADLTNNTNGSFVGGDYGIAMYPGSSITGTLTNKGTIRGNTGMFVSGSIAGGLINSGTIEGTGGTAVELSNLTQDLSLTLNGGQVIGDITDNAPTNGFSTVVIGDDYTTNDDTIITVSNLKVNAGQTLNIADHDHLKIFKSIENSGNIQGTGGTAISLSGLTQDLTMTLNRGRVIGDIYDDHITDGFSHVVIGDDFGTEGDVEVWDLKVNDGKTLTISSGNTLTLGRMIKSNGTYSFGLDGNGVVGKINVVGTGNGIDLEGSSVSVTVGTVTMAEGAELHVGSGNVAVIGMDGSTGQVATDVTDNSILWDFVVVDGSQVEAADSTDDTKLYLIASVAEVEEEPDTPDTPDTPNDSGVLEPHAETPNNKKVAVVLDGLMETSNPELQMIWTALNNAGTDEELNEIMEAVQGDANRGTVTAANYIANTAFDITSSRLLSIRSEGLAGSGISSGDLTSGLQVWVQGFGEVGNQSNRQGIKGFDLTSYGFAAGIDSEELVDDAVIGLSLGYSDTSVDSDGANNAKTDISSWQIGAYGDYDLGNQSYINVMAAYGYHNNEGRRVPVAGLVARSDYDAHQVMGRVEVGRAFPVSSSVTLTPKGLAQASWYSPEKYTETGAGGANLTIDQDDTAVAELGLGVDASWSHRFEQGSELEAIVGAQYRYDFVGEAVSSQMAFQGGGSAIASEGFDPAQSTVGLNAGLRYQVDDSWELSAQYDFDYKQDYRSHTGSIRAAYSF